MPVTTSYPGIYIQELPNLHHSVTPAPTSVTVFIGYTHPFKTKAFDVAVPIFSFTDYQDNFGGFFSFGPWLPDYMGNAVFQFFQNGGTTAWVVGIQSSGFVNASGVGVDATGKPIVDWAGQPIPGAVQATLSPAKIALDMSPGAGPAGSVTATLSALEPGGIDTGNNNAASGTLTQVTLANRRQTDTTSKNYDKADIIITCGSRAETYRSVAAANIAAALGQSALVTVTVAGGAPVSFPPTLPNDGLLAYTDVPQPGTTLVDPADYSQVFMQGASLDVDVKIFNLMVLPGMSPVSVQQSAVLSQALEYCEQKRAFFIMDAPPNAVTSSAGPAPTGQPLGTPAPVTMDDFWNKQTPPVSTNGAIYFPYLQAVDPLTQQPRTSPPSGFVAGVFAREDVAWSVGKAPAGLETTILGTAGVVPWGRMTDMQQGPLNNDGVNCLREFSGIGTVVFGARTLVSGNPAFEQWRYIPVRRTALFLEQSLYGSLGWATFQLRAARTPNRGDE